MVRLQRTAADHKDFVALVRRLDADLAERDGSDHSFYAQFNTLGAIKHAIVAYENTRPVGCGAMKQFDPRTMEIKRMYTRPTHRGKGVAAKVLAALEQWASELSCEKCILETGLRQPEAIALYTNNGYSPIPNYGPYAGVENSRCFEKRLNPLV